MAIRKEREYRYAELTEFRAIDEDGAYIVEGYATTFDEPYIMWEDYDGTKYKEVIRAGALDGADIKDVVFLFNHEGMVYARNNKTKTLELSTDEHGFKIRADLGSTTQSREMFETIKSGLVDKMSWAFSIAADGDEYDDKTKTRTISKIKKVYDVSAVTFPANPETEISARSFFEGAIERERAERLKIERARTATLIKLKGAKK